MISLALCGQSCIQGCSGYDGPASDRLVSTSDIAENRVGGRNNSRGNTAAYSGKHRQSECFLPDKHRTLEGVIRKTKQCWGEAIEKTEQRYGLERGILAGLLIRESMSYPLQLNSSGDGGAGLMMFQPGTAMAYGLKVYNGEKSTRADYGHGKKLRQLVEYYNHDYDSLSKIDERFDAEKSIDAAGRFLRDLHNRYKSWDRALSAYNRGKPARNSRRTKHVKATRRYQKMYLAGPVNKRAQKKVDLQHVFVNEGNRKNVFKYEVKRGDTLYSIARKFNEWDKKRGDRFLEVRHYDVLNGAMKRAYSKIMPGQKLYILAVKK